MEKQRIKDDMKECMVCHNFTLDEDCLFDICEVCNWENDEVQHKHPNWGGGANKMSLNEARKAWKEGRKVL